MTLQARRPVAPWSDPAERARALRAACGVALVVAAYVLWSAWAAGRAGGEVFGADFVTFYAAGSFAAAGDAGGAYDEARLGALALAMFGPKAALMPWPSPPPMLLLVGPLAGLPYAAAYGAWLALGLAALMLVLRGACPRSDARTLALVLALASPAMLVNLLSGQGGMLVAALLTGALWFADRRPVLAGLCAGLLIVKPHAAVLVPLAYLAGGHGRAFAWAALTTGVLVATSAAYGGAGVWAEWLALLRGTTVGSLGEVAFDVRSPSVFAGARMLGLSVPGATMAQGVAALAAAAVTWTAWHPPRVSRADRVTLVLLAAPLVTPYLWTYDLVAGAVGVALLASAGTRDRGPAETVALTACWLAPLSVMVLLPWESALPACNLASLAAFAAVARGALRARHPRFAPVPA